MLYLIFLHKDKIFLHIKSFLLTSIYVHEMILNIMLFYYQDNITLRYKYFQVSTHKINIVKKYSQVLFSIRNCYSAHYFQRHFILINVISGKCCTLKLRNHGVTTLGHMQSMTILLCHRGFLGRQCKTHVKSSWIGPAEY